MNDIDIGNYFIKKKFNLDQILRKPRIVNGVRQKPITKKYIDNFVLHNAELNGRTDTEIRNFHRNEKLIDLKHTPKELSDSIWEEYRKEPKGSRANLLNFFVEKRLSN